MVIDINPSNSVAYLAPLAVAVVLPLSLSFSLLLIVFKASSIKLLYGYSNKIFCWSYFSVHAQLQLVCKHAQVTEAAANLTHVVTEFQYYF